MMSQLAIFSNEVIQSVLSHQKLGPTLYITELHLLWCTTQAACDPLVSSSLLPIHPMQQKLYIWQKEPSFQRELCCLQQGYSGHEFILDKNSKMHSWIKHLSKCSYREMLCCDRPDLDQCLQATH